MRGVPPAVSLCRNSGGSAAMPVAAFGPRSAPGTFGIDGVACVLALKDAVAAECAALPHRLRWKARLATITVHVPAMVPVPAKIRPDQSGRR